MAGVLLDRGNYRWAVMGLHRAPHTQGFEATELNFLKRIGIHLRRSLQIHRQISLVQQDNISLYTVLDCLKSVLFCWIRISSCLIQIHSHKA